MKGNSKWPDRWDGALARLWKVRQRLHRPGWLRRPRIPGWVSAVTAKQWWQILGGAAAAAGVGLYDHRIGLIFGGMLLYASILMVK